MLVLLVRVTRGRAKCGRQNVLAEVQVVGDCVRFESIPKRQQITIVSYRCAGSLVSSARALCTLSLSLSLSLSRARARGRALFSVAQPLGFPWPETKTRGTRPGASFRLPLVSEQEKKNVLNLPLEDSALGVLVSHTSSITFNPSNLPPPPPSDPSNPALMSAIAVNQLQPIGVS